MKKFFKLNSGIKAVIATVLMFLFMTIIITLSVNFPKIMLIVLFLLSFCLFGYSMYRIFKSYFELKNK